MDLDDIKRGLRAEIKKRENEQYFTFQCNVREMCKDVLAKLEEQESEIAELENRLPPEAQAVPGDGKFVSLEKCRIYLQKGKERFLLPLVQALAGTCREIQGGCIR